MKYKILIMIAGFFLVLASSGCTNNNPSGGNGTFENEWVKFSYPPGMVVVDVSSSDNLLVQIYKNGTNSSMITTLNFASNSKKDLLDQFPNATNSTVAGRAALTAQDEEGRYIYIFLGPGDQTLVLYFDPTTGDAFQLVRDTLVIKKVPS
ncbi:MAG: hypothetical protein Q8N08_04700 [Methanobacteriaceae archaeon]|nr:hypothetical protein [Methanobacteriaceae archaeon]